MSIINKLPLIGIYGGTFDPIHYGHLRIAEELCDTIGLQKIFFVPSGLPRLRQTPAASREHRAAMVRLAIEGNPRFELDTREINRTGVTATVQTLREYQHETRIDAAFCFILGIDAFIKIDQWTEWLELFNLCHFIIVARPGFASLTETQQFSDDVQHEFLSRRTAKVSDLALQSSGFIYTAQTSMLDISASQIRTLLSAGKSIRYLLPEKVHDYIKSNRLYT
ncbi:MAG: nicotinic acid mononucleotide adenylyltransferase [Proteobacteria bacterium SG_bin4]|nr:MAG: nicotinic acid mononucleotide adenylyltransferase [Proteobacteria bacterium SG_bin4]